MILYSRIFKNPSKLLRDHTTCILKKFKTSVGRRLPLSLTVPSALNSDTDRRGNSQKIAERRIAQLRTKTMRHRKPTRREKAEEQLRPPEDREGSGFSRSRFSCWRARAFSFDCFFIARAGLSWGRRKRKELAQPTLSRRSLLVMDGGVRD